MNPAEARALVTAVDRLALHLERIGEKAWIRCADYRFAFVNHAFARYMALPRTDLESRPDHEMFQPAEVLHFRAGDRRCVEVRRPVFVEEASDFGELIDTVKFPLILPSGRVAGVAGIAYPFAGRVCAGAQPDWLRRVKRRLADRFTTPPSIAGLARGAGVSADHLARSFKRRYGLGIHEYVRALRVEWCTWSLVEAPDRSLAELAVLAGFADQSHLTREFRRVRGITPGRLRDHWRETGARRTALSTPRESSAWRPCASC